VGYNRVPGYNGRDKWDTMGYNGVQGYNGRDKWDTIGCRVTMEDISGIQWAQEYNGRDKWDTMQCGIQAVMRCNECMNEDKSDDLGRIRKG
jgi:hypothetical protein